MSSHEIIRLKPEDYQKCGNIWDMEKDPARTQNRYNQLVSGNSIVFVYVENGEFIGEGSLVLEMNDTDYTIPKQRICFSRLVVKSNRRNQGIGGVLIDRIVNEAAKMGYSEVSIGVDKKNEGALRLYRRKGFDEIIFDGEDEYGTYYKLLKRLEARP